MKKIFLLSAVMAAAFSVLSQNLEQAKSLLALHKYKEAIAELEKVSGMQSNLKPEAYILKASIYSGMLNDGLVKEKTRTDELANTAEAAFEKYRQLDPAMSLLSDPVYQSCPIDLYTVFYTLGYNDYAAKNWNAAFGKIKKAVGYSDLLIEKKLMAAALDTNVIIMAGVISENSGQKDDAANYYKRLADSQVKGDGFETIYRYLVNYYFQKSEMAAFEKYKSMGAINYPASEYFSFDKVDFAVGLAADFTAKVKALEKILATDAGSYKANEVLGELIYDELNPKDTLKPMPPNAAELEKKMITAFNKAAVAKPGFENPFIYMGDHFISKAAVVGNTKTKLLSDAAKTAALEQDYAAALFAAQEPYEKAAAIFSARTTLNKSNKLQYKKAAGYLAEIAAYKKAIAKSNAAEQKKWADAEAKWNAVAESIK